MREVGTEILARWPDDLPTEIVFKYRHPDLQKTADVDIRPQIAGAYRIKFKAEALPLKGQIGSVRTLYSHNAQFPLSHVHAADRAALSTLLRLLPPLRGIKNTIPRSSRSRSACVAWPRSCSAASSGWLPAG